MRYRFATVSTAFLVLVLGAFLGKAKGVGDNWCCGIGYCGLATCTRTSEDGQSWWIYCDIVNRLHTCTESNDPADIGKDCSVQQSKPTDPICSYVYYYNTASDCEDDENLQNVKPFTLPPCQSGDPYCGTLV